MNFAEGTILKDLLLESW